MGFRLGGVMPLVAVVACASCAISSSTQHEERTGETSSAYATSFAAPQIWSTFPAFGTYGALLADVTRDGRKDLVTLGSSSVTVSVSTDAGFVTPATWLNTSFYGIAGTLIGDVDGDARADLIALGTASVQVALASHTSHAFDAPQTWYTSGFLGAKGTLLGDVDGDGRADLIALNASTVTVSLSTGSGFAPAATWWSGPFYGSHGTFVGDVDGDGRADLVGCGDGYVGAILSKGNGFGGYQTWWNSSFYGAYGTLLGDVDDDGKADLVGLGNGYIGVIKSTGKAFGTYMTWYGQTFEGEPTFLGDVSGDGNADLVGVMASGTQVMLATGGGYQGGQGLGSHRVFPQFPSGGQTIHSPRIVTIVAQNDDSTGSDSPAYLNAFGAAFAASQTWAKVSSEYGLGSISNVTLTGPMLSGQQTQAQLTSYVEGVVATSGITPNGSTIYLLFLPASSSFASPWTNACGYHVYYPGTTTDAIAFAQRCGTMSKAQTTLDRLTMVASHEVVESASNPHGKGYIFKGPYTVGSTPVWQMFAGPGGVELGDACEGTAVHENVGATVPPNGWEFQRMWSNTAAAAGGDPCIPAASATYFSVDVPKDWYPVSPGTSVSIPVSGWSVAAAGGWDLDRSMGYSATNTAFTNASFVLHSPMGLGTGYTCVQHQEMTAGMTANLEAVAPVSAQPGDFAIVEVKSLVEDVTTCDPVLGQDYYHFRPVGVYVCASEGNDCTQNSDCCPSLICNASGQEPVCSPPNCGGPNVPCQSGAACCSGSCDTNAGFCN